MTTQMKGNGQRNKTKWTWANDKAWHKQMVNYKIWHMQNDNFRIWHKQKLN